TSELVRVPRTRGGIARTSLPATSGAARMLHRLKAERISRAVNAGDPTGRMSGSFHAPGPAKPASPASVSMVESIADQGCAQPTSPLTRHRFATCRPQDHGSRWPQLLTLNTIG